MAHRVKDLLVRPNPFAKFSALASKHGAINLGQGFPSFSPPSFLNEALEQAMKSPRNHQYTLPAGNPLLSSAVSEVYNPLYQTCFSSFPTTISTSSNKAPVIANDCITVYCGAQEAVFCILLAFANPGDEIVIVEPSFDCPVKSARMLDLNIKTVTLKQQQNQHTSRMQASDFVVDVKELRASLTANTRILFLNSPSNPLGKVLSPQEMSDIAAVVKDFP
eukprot:c12340_g1_i3.p1 GENE.c12340_g1_i3~~c12340_g1_i3.p1  ORF type:complete len:231 (+),score=57.36 c12340_g1_i3:34-693(+)